jgi:hypothetical protein
MAGGHAGELRRDRILAEVEGGEALRLARALAGADQQSPDPDRHRAEQGAERRAVMPLAGQRPPTGGAAAATLAHDRHLGRHHPGLDCGGELLGLLEPEPELRQAGLLVALEARDLGFRRHAGLQLRHQPHPPHQLRHRTLLPP